MNSDSHNKGDCGTSFKSEVKLREFDNGPLIRYNKVDGEYQWQDAVAGNVIEFDVQTKESDDCVAKLVTMDMEYVGKVTNSVTEALGDNATPDNVMAEVMKNIELSKMFITVRSKSFETDSSGNYTGQFTIENTFKEMPLYLLLSYGYSGKAERGNWETAWDEVGSEVALLIAEEIVWALACAAIVAASGGTATPLVAASYGAKAAKWGSRGAKVASKGKAVIKNTGKAVKELGVRGSMKAAFKSKAALRDMIGAKKYYLAAATHMATWMGGYLILEEHKDQMGMVDINKSGCQFPAGGYTHSYSFTVGGSDEEWLTFLSTMTPESVGYAEVGIETQSSTTGVLGTATTSPFMVYGGLTLLGLVLAWYFTQDEGGDV